MIVHGTGLGRSLVEQLDALCEIGERAGETVDLVDHDDVDPMRADLIEQTLKGWAI